MAWLLVAILGAASLLFVALYKRALSEALYVNSLLILVLLDENVYRAQRTGLVNFVKTTPAGSAHELANKANASLTNLAGKLAQTSVLGAPGMLWKARQD